MSLKSLRKLVMMRVLSKRVIVHFCLLFLETAHTIPDVTTRINTGSTLSVWITECRTGNASHEDASQIGQIKESLYSITPPRSSENCEKSRVVTYLKWSTIA